MKINYNWLKDYIGEGLPVVTEVESLLTTHAFEIDGVEQVGDELVIDVDVLPNRSSDCLCHRGIARELATILGCNLKYDPLTAPPPLTWTDQIVVSIEDEEACPRFTASLVTGIEIKESPGWLKARLESLGQRSINNIVDATNYVMYAIGQPLHAYDADLFPKVDGVWHMGVRFAREGEVVNLLAEGGKDEERVIECTGTELLIVDKSSDTPIGLAGVKGGKFAGVHPGTKSVIIEAAHFDPIITRKTARRLGIVIDASKRFENEPSRGLPPFGQFEIVKLIKDIAGGEYVGTVDQNYILKPNPQVNVRLSRCNALLGLSLSAVQVKELLVRTGSVVEEIEGDVFACTGPWERTDLLIEEDFIEEIGRLYGLSSIQSIPPSESVVEQVNKRQFYSDRVRRVLLAAGFSEVITTSFQKKDTIQLQNALASDKSYVRSQLRKNITATLDMNYGYGDLLGTASVQVFEIGTVFTKANTEIQEHLSLAIGVRGKGSGYTSKDDVALQNALDLVSAAIGTTVDWQTDRGVAEANFDAIIELLETPAAYEPFIHREVRKFTPISPYPAVSRDIALWVQNDVATEVVAQTIKTEAGELCIRLDQFDEFEKDGRISYAYRLVFQSHTKTLTDSEVNTIMNHITNVAQDRGWEVR